MPAPFLSKPPQIYYEKNIPARSKSLFDVFVEKLKGRVGTVACKGHLDIFHRHTKNFALAN